MLDGEPIDPSAVDGATRRIFARTQMALVSLGASIELARPFARELEAALELAGEWGVHRPDPGRGFEPVAPVLH